MRLFSALGVLLLICTPDVVCADTENIPFSFALVGDFPYSPREMAMAERLIAEVATDSELAWVVHVGDIRGREFDDCSDVLYQKRAALFARFRHPFVFTPGDNDWLDCREPPTARLAALRRVFYSDDTALPTQQRQSAMTGFEAFVENRLWTRAGVLFATVHLIQPPLLGFADDATEQTYRDSLDAANAWLQLIFAQARQQQVKAVFIAFQADLWAVTGLPRTLPLIAPGALEVDTRLEPFVETLRDNVASLGLPVVVANGDTHFFRVDKPLVDKHLNPYENFTRVEAFGSPLSHWVRVEVDPGRPEVFSFRQEIIEANVFTTQIPGQPAPQPFEPPASYRWLEVLALLPPLKNALAGFGALCALYFLTRPLWRRLRR